MKLKTINLNKLLLIILASIFTGIVYNAISPKGIEFIRHEKKIENASQNDLAEILKNDSEGTINTSDSKILKISSDQAYHIFKDSTALFIDARDQWEFAEGHIPNATNIAEYKFEPDLPIVKSLNKKISYVLYCGDDDCEVSMRLAAEMQKLGFEKLLVFEGGWREWINANYPVEKDN